MAKPQPLQLLSHGKALCKKVFSGFVDTFNYAVLRIDNLTGDGDGENAQGRITVDNADPEHPVIRLKETGESYVSGADGSGVNVSENVIDLDGRGKGDRMAVRSLTVTNAEGHAVSIRVLSTAIDDDDRAEEEEEDPGDDGHETAPDEGGDDADPAQREDEEAGVEAGEDGGEGVPDGGVPDCGSGGGVSAGSGSGGNGGTWGGGDFHSGDGCNNCD